MIYRFRYDLIQVHGRRLRHDPIFILLFMLQNYKSYKSIIQNFEQLILLHS